MRCDNCNCTETYIKKYNNVYTIKNEEIKFESERRFCKNCNSLVYDDKLDNKASVLAISIYNEKHGISNEIINLRKKYNISQDLFSKIIGCAKKTLISYEKGKSVPNDIYLIIIKSIISNPEIMITLIAVNKDQFTDKELKKINLIKSNSNDNLCEYNGYTKLSLDKIYNMILFFSDSGILKTKLLKEMFYADFVNYKNTCKSITGLEYAKLPFGPVPNNFESLLNKCVTDNIIDYNVTYNNEYESHNIKSKKEFNKKIFTKDELDTMNKIKEKFKNFSSKDIVEYSHQEKAFLNNDFYNKISYDYSFDISL